MTTAMREGNFQKKLLTLFWKCRIVLLAPSDGELAQLGERMTGSHEVRGSIPLFSTKYSGGALVAFLLGPVAQRLAQGTHNPWVGGSNPSGPTRDLSCR